jgi:hypothetical protein
MCLVCSGISCKRFLGTVKDEGNFVTVDTLLASAGPGGKENICGLFHNCTTVLHYIF